MQSITLGKSDGSQVVLSFVEKCPTITVVRQILASGFPQIVGEESIVISSADQCRKMANWLNRAAKILEK